eukprot:scaffold2639_cov361-Pavlova_lutheri.AAC.31
MSLFRSSLDCFAIHLIDKATLSFVLPPAVHQDRLPWKVRRMKGTDVFNMKVLCKIRPKGSSVLKGCGSTLYVFCVLVSPVEALDARFVSHRTHILTLESACLWVRNLNNQVVYDLGARDRSL